MERRVVVTGMGTINPLGTSVESFWENIKNGVCGVSTLTRVDPDEFTCKVSAEVKDFDASQWLDKKEYRKMALFTQYATAGAVQAMSHAGLDDGNYDSSRIGVILGNGIGGFEVIEEAYMKLFASGAKRIPPMVIPKLISNEGPGNIAIRFNANGPCYTVTTACASGTDAIGTALNQIQSGACDIVITGGTEGAVTRLGFGGFSVLKTLSTHFNDEPQRASRPFDRDRDGFVMGEGSGILVLETLEHAKKRGAHIHAEVAGYGQTCDANHLTAPLSCGTMDALAMKLAMKQAQINPEDVDYINAHGTSTPTNDPIETRAIKIAMGDHAKKLKVSSTKGMTGHLIGGAGGIEAIISILAIRDGFFPATINLDNPDDECDLDYVPHQGQEGTINTVISNSLGFGGHNGALVFKRFTA